MHQPSAAERRITIVLADDHTVMRCGLGCVPKEAAGEELVRAIRKAASAG
jgi:hypothetical protein